MFIPSLRHEGDRPGWEWRLEGARGRGSVGTNSVLIDETPPARMRVGVWDSIRMCVLGPPHHRDLASGRLSPRVSLRDPCDGGVVAPGGVGLAAAEVLPAPAERAHAPAAEQGAPLRATCQ